MCDLACRAYETEIFILLMAPMRHNKADRMGLMRQPTVEASEDGFVPSGVTANFYAWLLATACLSPR